MDDLISFLRARLDETEQNARRWVRKADGLDLTIEGEGGSALVNVYVDDNWWDAEKMTVAEMYERYYDEVKPDQRTLADVEAKRRMVEHHAPNSERDLCTICTEVGPDAQGWPCQTLRLLALPYADHPDYREEWRPDTPM